MAIQPMLITSVNNERVKHWASLLEKKHRDRHRLFIIEGIHLLKEAIKGKYDIEAICYDTNRGLPAEIEAIVAEVSASTKWYEATDIIIKKCTDTDSPPPIFAVVKKFTVDHKDVISENSLIVALDGVRDPGNVGTIIRSCDAVGASAVVLGKGCVDVYNPKTVRSTMGSLFHLPIIEIDLLDFLPMLKEKGIHVIGTSLQATEHCFNFNWSEPACIVMGSEGEGLSSSVEAEVNKTVIIPMQGKSESLNVAMATTVMLYEAMRQRQYS